MNNERFLVFDIDDTLYSQMEPLLTACEFSLGRKLPDPELFYRIFGKRSAEMFLFSESGQVSIYERPWNSLYQRAGRALPEEI